MKFFDPGHPPFSATPIRKHAFAKRKTKTLGSTPRRFSVKNLALLNLSLMTLKNVQTLLWSSSDSLTVKKHEERLLRREP